MNIDSECNKCESDLLFKPIKFISKFNTVDELIKNKKSIARFGNGEFIIIFGGSIGFQQYNETLKENLIKILKSNKPNLLLAIPQLYKVQYKYWIKFLEKYKFKLAKIINKNKVYYHSGITRIFHQISNRTIIRNYVNNFKKIWDNRNILIIEGEKTRLGIGNDLFNNSKSIQRIICPAENAFNVYDKLLKYIKSLKIDKNTLILISLGPTATVLAYDICDLGNQVIDFGHFDIEYELYLRNATKVIKLQNKYVVEAEGGSFNITPVNDKNYLDQIIYKIY